MKRLFAMFLALLLCVLPAMGSAESFAATDTALPRLISSLAQLMESKNPQLTASFTNPAGDTWSAVLGQKTEGGKAIALNFPGAELIISRLLTTLTREDGSYSLSMAEPLQTAISPVAVPEVDEEDLDALVLFAASLLSRVSRQAVNYSLSNNMLSLHINLDALLQDIDTAIPELLLQYADKLDPVLSGMTALLLPQGLTCADLASLWPALGLSSLHTGIEADVSVMTMGDSVNVSAVFMGHKLTMNLSAATVSLSFLPAGAQQAYVLDTQDILTVSEMLMGIPTYSITDDKENNTSTLDIAITRQAILDAIDRNSMTIDMLLCKYDPWIRLLTGRTPAAASTTSATDTASPAGISQLVDLDDLASVVSQMPETLFSMHGVRDDNDHTFAITGELMGLDYTVDLQQGRYGAPTTWNATISDRNPSMPLNIRCSGLVDYNGNFTVSMNSNQPIGGAYAMNLRVQNGIVISGGYRVRGTQISLTTDTDVFHFLYKDAYGETTELDVRMGDVSFTFGQPYRSATMTHTLDIGGKLMTSHISESHLNISSEAFGLDVLATENGGIMTGYLMDRYDACTFTLQYDEENELFTLNLMQDTYSLYMACQPGELKILEDGEEIVLRKAAPGTWHLLLNGELFATLLTEYSADNQYRFQLLPGDGTAGAGFTLLFRFGADPIVLPADAKPCTPEEFLQILQSTFFPAAAPATRTLVTE